MPLVDIYKLMTALPGTLRDYQQIDFARDLYRLEDVRDDYNAQGHAHAADERINRSEETLSQRLTFIAPGGREITYYGIRFGDQT